MKTNPRLEQASEAATAEWEDQHGPPGEFVGRYSLDPASCQKAFYECLRTSSECREFDAKTLNKEQMWVMMDVFLMGLATGYKLHEARADE